jgi:nucleotide-binding universal stress UspA family protein
MFKQILVPIDGSDDGWVALDQAIELAREEESTIQALFVADSRIIEAPYWTAAPPDEPLPGGDEDKARLAIAIGETIADFGDKALTLARNKCEEAGVPCDARYEIGPVTNTILEAAKHADLLVLGRHGQGAVWAGPHLGSVFEAVVRHAPCPVLATQAEMRPLLKILVAYDDSDRARDALRIGARLAQSQNRDLVVLVVNDGHPRMKKAFDEVRAWLDRHDIPAKTLFEEGPPADTILQVAREEDASLIVIGAYGHSHFLEIFFGSAVDEVVHQAIVPVMICH